MIFGSEKQERAASNRADRRGANVNTEMTEKQPLASAHKRSEIPQGHAQAGGVGAWIPAGSPGRP